MQVSIAWHLWYFIPIVAEAHNAGDETYPLVKPFVIYWAHDVAGRENAFEVKTNQNVSVESTCTNAPFICQHHPSYTESLRKFCFFHVFLGHELIVICHGLLIDLLMHLGHLLHKDILRVQAHAMFLRWDRQRIPRTSFSIQDKNTFNCTFRISSVISINPGQGIKTCESFDYVSAWTLVFCDDLLW